MSHEHQSSWGDAIRFDLVPKPKPKPITKTKTKTNNKQKNGSEFLQKLADRVSLTVPKRVDGSTGTVQ